MFITLETNIKVDFRNYWLDAFVYANKLALSIVSNLSDCLSFVFGLILSFVVLPCVWFSIFSFSFFLLFLVCLWFQLFWILVLLLGLLVFHVWRLLLVFFGFSFLISSCIYRSLWLIKVIPCFTMCLYICLSFVLVEVVGLGKMRLYVRSRKQGSYIASVPLKQLVKLSACRRRRWDFKDGWLILEAF